MVGRQGALTSCSSLLVPQETQCGDFKAVVVEVAGRAFYTGVSTFIQEPEDRLTGGFLLS